jgi:hypothetical protein
MAGTFSKRKQKKVLECLAEGQFVTTACKNAGVSRSWFNKFRKREENAAFAEAVEDAIAEGTGIYEDELRTRVLEGEPVLDKDGNHVGDRKSDRLLEFALKARDRETYGDKVRSEVTGKDGGPIQQQQETTILSPEQKKAEIVRLREVLGKRE